MILPIALAAWILSLVFVTGLCLAARGGDVQMLGGPVGEPVGEPPADSVEVVLIVHEVAVVAAAA